MIGFIEGDVKIVGEDFLMIQTAGGVGYNVFVTSTLLSQVSINSKVSLFVETLVKEDSITLFGFQAYQELIWFKSLIKVSGVGSRIAMLILSSFKMIDIISALENQDKEFFTSISGIGEKLAIRLVNELKKEPKKNANTMLSVSLEKLEKVEEVKVSTSSSVSLVKDASSALESLGFAKNLAHSVALKIFTENQDITLNDLIKLSLKSLKD